MSYSRRLCRGYLFAFRCCKSRIIFFVAIYYRKDGFFMQNFLSALGIRKFSTKDICVLGLFIALSCVFTLQFTLRIGKEIEISLNFIPIFIIAALYGPFFAGITALLSDIVSAIIFPLGPIIPWLCVTAFVSGVIYGMFYRDYKLNKTYVIKLIICVILQFLLSIFINSFILYNAYGSKSFTFWVAFRFPASFIKIFLQSAVIILAPKSLTIFSKQIKQ